MKNLIIQTIFSGGIITNYYCTSRCAHCLYACSPKWEKRYITREQARNNFKWIKDLGCYSVHIGGGEPFLNFDGLLDVLDIANQEGIGIDYIETNSSWFVNKEKGEEQLRAIRAKGVSTLLISISPFHNEYIPLCRVKELISACQRTGLSVFPWVQGFMNDLSRFDDSSTHSLKEYSEVFGKEYLAGIPNRYWTHFGGRAIDTFKQVFELTPLESILNKNNGCTELSKTDHFHVDLFGNYIPGLCSGFSIHIDDLGKELNENRYPFILMLYSKGIRAFYDMAVNMYGFNPEYGYLNKCHLCLEIRKYLVNEVEIESIELQPNQYYMEL
ncbi:MAG: radical SAM protein [Bacteroidales bacterium]|nr:radical SAM protein [Bacteroidales bacterium]